MRIRVEKAYKNTVKRKMRHAGGFTLIELLVVTAIFVVITSVSLVGYQQFTSRTLLTSLAYDIALSGRQAQSFGLSVRGDVKANEFNIWYGLHLDPDNNTSYVLFADANRDKLYDNGGSPCGGECVDRFVLGRGYTISDICATRTTGSTICTSDNVGLSYIDIMFARPNPTAIILDNNGDIYDQVDIKVQATNGQERTVSVFSAGQVTVLTGS